MTITELRKFVDIGAKLLCSQSAVQPHNQRVGMAHRVIKGFESLAGQCAPGRVRNGPGDHDGKIQAAVVEYGSDRIQRRFRV